MRHPLMILATLAISGCAATTGPVTAPVMAVSRSAAIAAECRMLEEAHALTLAAEGRAPADILTGCPGHENARDEMPLKAQSAALRRAGVAAIPPVVQALGVQGPRVYRRMITRGVPEAVAQQMAPRASFAAASRR